MLVEDDPLIVEFTEKNLIKDGFEVIVATTGNDALELMSTHRADIILLDIMLPDMDGFEVCRRIRQCDVPRPSLVPADVPIVMLTAMGSETDVVRGFKLGADDYIVKPFSPTELLARISRLSRKKAAKKMIIKTHHSI